MTTALEGDERSVERHGHTLPPGKTRYPFYRRLGGPQGRSERAENLVPTGIWSRTVQPVVSRYTDWATGPTYEGIIPEENTGRCLVPTRIWSRTVQPVVSRYTDWATGPTNEGIIPEENTGRCLLRDFFIARFFFFGLMRFGVDDPWPPLVMWWRLAASDVTVTPDSHVSGLTTLLIYNHRALGRVTETSERRKST